MKTFMDQKLLVVVTYSDDKPALTEIADSLMMLGVPSVHLSVVESWYRWKGKRYNADEFRLDVLCPKELLVDVVNLIKQGHNYDAPAITWYEVDVDESTYGWGTGVKL